MATKKKNIRLQPRDIEIFDWLYKFRFLTADQIAGLVEAVEEKVSLSEYEFREGYYGIIRRIKLLKNANYLKDLTNIFQKYVYTLDKKAIDELVLEKAIPREDIQRVLEQRKRGDKHLAHALMIAEFGATLALACKQRPGIKLLTWLPESNEIQVEIHLTEDELTPAMKKWQKSGQGYGVTLKKKPDVIFGLENQHGQTAWFILEADRGTMTSKRFLQKMAAYYYFKIHDKFGEWSQKLNLHPQGKPINTFRIITYTVTPQWQDVLIKTTLRVNPDQTGSKMFWFTNQTLVDTEKPETMFERIFSIAEKDELSQLNSII